MKKIFFLMTSLGWVLSSPSALAVIQIISPLDQGVVTSDRVVLEVGGCKVHDFVTHLNGTRIKPRWYPSRYPRRWWTEIVLPADVKSHQISVSGKCGLLHRKTVRTRFVRFRGSSAALGEAVAGRFLKVHPKAKRLSWNWKEGYFLYGLARLAEVSPLRADYLSYIRDFHRFYFWKKRKPKINRSAKVVPALSVFSLLDDDEDLIAFSNGSRVADYLLREKLNTEGSINTLGGKSPASPWFMKSSWVDGLSQWAVFAARWGRYFDDEVLKERGEVQPLTLAEVLQDEESGLFARAWASRKKRLVPKQRVHWLLGNGWAAQGIADILANLPKTDESFFAMTRVLKALVDGVVDFQTPAGLWDQVLDVRGYSYEETAGSAFLAYGIARGVNLGALPPGYIQYALKTFHGLTARLRKKKGKGYILEDTAQVGWPSRKLGYKSKVCTKDAPHGVGAYLLLAAELAAYEL